jgi:hypothetical protein
VNKNINKTDDKAVVSQYINHTLRELITLKTILLRDFISTDDVRGKVSKGNRSYALLDTCTRMMTFFETLKTELIK